MHPGARELLRKLGQISVDADALELLLSKPEPRRRYLVFFTPRSGSSWLTELLSSNPGFGQPSEWFNDSLIPDVAAHVGVDNMFDYMLAVPRAMADVDTHTFGAEVTFFQLEVMRQLVDFFQHLPLQSTHVFYLSRKDIVAQAISLYRAVKTGIFHSSDLRDDRPATVEYNVEEIDYWLEHIRQQELGVEALFRDSAAPVHRLFYEEMIAEGAGPTLNRFSLILHANAYTGTVTAPRENQRLSSRQSSEWVERYRLQRPVLCARLALERLHDSGRSKSRSE